MLLNIFFLFFTFSKQQSDTQPRVSHLNVLLPQIFEKITNRQISCEILAYNGCYEWVSSHPDIIQIQHSQKSCNDQIKAKSISITPFHNIVWITARDQKSGESIRIESKIQKLDRIEILTKLRTVDVGDVQLLELQGYDAEGNVFTSLEGLKFEWKINQKKQSSQFIKFKSGNFKVSEQRKILELQGFQTDNILIHGLETGQSVVSVELLEKGYQNVTTKVKLSIVEHFQVTPDQNIYMATETSFKFKISILKSQNQNISYQNIHLPSQNYYFKTNQTKFFDIQQNGLIQSKKELGQGQLVISDTRIENNFQQFDINIVKPEKLSIEVGEYDATNTEIDNNWNWVQYKEYQLVINVKDSNDNIIIFTKEQLLKIHFDQNHFKLVKQSGNKFIIIGLINQEIPFQIELFINQKSVLQKKQLVIVYPQIQKIDQNQIIHLPPDQIYQLDIYGGSDYYDFGSQDTSIFKVNKEGLITPTSIGTSIIEIKDKKNHKNKLQIQVYVTQVAKISFYEKIKEILVNTTQQGFISAFGLINNTYHNYSNCSMLKFTYKSAVQISNINGNLIDDIMNDENLYIYQNTHFKNTNFEKRAQKYHYSGICGQYLVTSKQHGEFPIIATYQNNQDELKVFVLLGMSNYLPKLDTVLVAFNSEFDWEIQNGPRLHQGREQRKYITIMKDDKIIQQPYLKIENKKDKLYKILCVKPADLKNKQLYTVQINVQNMEDHILQRPYLDSIKIKVRCEHPEAIKLSLIHSDYIQNTTVYLKNNDEYDIIAQPYDSEFNSFYSYNSLTFDIKGESNSTFLISGIEQKRKISFKNIEDYITVFCNSNRFVSGEIYDEIKDNQKFYVSNQAKFEKQQSLMFLSPWSKTQINILHGSQYYRFWSNSTDLSTKYIQNILFAQSNHSGIYNVYLEDLLQLNSIDQQMQISVQPAKFIKIQTNQNIYLQNSEISIKIQVFDQYNNLFPEDQYQYMNIIIDDNKNKISFKYSNLTFKANAEKIGDFKVSARIQDIVSNTIEIHIYPELQANMNKIYLAKGCITYLQLSGGPTEKQMQKQQNKRNQYEIAFESQQDNKNINVILQLDKIYQIEAQELGTSNIIFTYKQKNVIYHQLKINVYVETLKSIELPNKQIHKKSTSRIIPLIRLNSDYLSFSMCQFTYNYIYDKKHISLIHDFLYAANITAQQTGQSQLQLTINNIKSESQIKIVEPLSLEFNSYILHPLHSNLDLILPTDSIYKPNLAQGIKIISFSENIIISDDRQVQIGKKGYGQIRLMQEEEITTINVLITDIDSIFIENSFKLLQVPIDSISRHKIFLLDSNGQVFPDQIYGLQFKINILNPLIADFEIIDDLLLVKGKKKGTTLCEISLKGIKDIVMITVGGIISPNQLWVHEGGIIQFPNGQKDYKWISLNPNLISINYHTGRAQAHSQGVAIIQYKEAAEYNITVNVQKVSQITTNLKELANVNQMIQYIPFKAYSDKEEILIFSKLDEIDNSLQFICTCDNQFVSIQGEIKQEGERQKIYCRVEFKLQIEQELAKNIKINVQIKSNAYNFNFQKQFEFGLQWGIVTNLESDQVVIKNQQKEIIVKSNYDLSINCDKKKFVKITQSNNQYNIIVNVKDKIQEYQIICNIYCPFTQEKKQITINYQPENIDFSYGDYFQFIIAICLLLVTIWYFQGSSQKTIQRKQPIYRAGVFTGNESSYRKQANLNLLKNFD